MPSRLCSSGFTILRKKRLKSVTTGQLSSIIWRILPKSAAIMRKKRNILSLPTHAAGNANSPFVQKRSPCLKRRIPLWRIITSAVYIMFTNAMPMRAKSGVKRLKKQSSPPHTEIWRSVFTTTLERAKKRLRRWKKLINLCPKATVFSMNLLNFMRE